eukprot:6306139-Amphidinium_carterae.3
MERSSPRASWRPCLPRLILTANWCHDRISNPQSFKTADSNVDPLVRNAAVNHAEGGHISLNCIAAALHPCAALAHFACGHCAWSQGHFMRLNKLTDQH